jgi:hypothetical protein
MEGAGCGAPRRLLLNAAIFKLSKGLLIHAGRLSEGLIDRGILLGWYAFLV